MHKNITIVIVSVVFGILSACSSGPEYPDNATPEKKAEILRLYNIKNDSPYIKEVEEEWNNQRLYVKFKNNSASEDAFIRRYILFTPEFLKNIEKHAPGQYKQVQIAAYMDTVDQQGRSGESREMRVYYKWDEVRDLKLEEINTYNVMNLADEISFQRLGLESAVEFCKLDELASQQKKFCTLVLKNVLGIE